MPEQYTAAQPQPDLSFFIFRTICALPNCPASTTVDIHKTTACSLLFVLVCFFSCGLLLHDKYHYKQ